MTGPVAGEVPAAVASTAGGPVPGEAPVELVLEHLRAGRPVIVVDAEDREDEGDVVLAAELASPEWIAWTVRHSSGFLCAPMAPEIADHLDLPPMVAHSEDVRGTAYTVSVDAAHGVTTGISASDRATTLRVLGGADSVRDDLHRPGHVLPLRAVPGGVRVRAGHTEASVDLVTAAGLRPVAAICEIVGDDGEMLRLPGLLELGAREGVPVVTIASFVAWLDARDADDAPVTSSTSTSTSTASTSTATTTTSDDHEGATA